MNQYLFIKLLEKVHTMNFLKVVDYEMENHSEIGFATFLLHKNRNANYYLELAAGQLILTTDNASKAGKNPRWSDSGELVLFKLSNEEYQKYENYIISDYANKNANEIEEAKNDDAYWSWVEHQDNLGHIQRHGW